MTGATATAGFHAYDEELGQNRTFRPGDEVPAHIADRVGEHVVSTGGKAHVEKAIEENTKKDDAPPAGETKPGDAFDPDKHNVADVLAYLESAEPAESERVRAAEKAGQARKGILGDE